MWRSIAKIEMAELGGVAYDIGRDLAALRKGTQAGQAARLGVSQPELAHWERGHNLWRLRLHVDALASEYGSAIYAMTIGFAAAEANVQAALHEAASRVLKAYRDALAERLAFGLAPPAAPAGEPTLDDARNAAMRVWGKHIAIGPEELAWILKMLRETRPRREGRA
jgi:transcriptional regulator with XRE-family HTH domain